MSLAPRKEMGTLLYIVDVNYVVNFIGFVTILHTPQNFISHQSSNLT